MSYLQKHLTNLADELFEIQDKIIDTDNIPNKQLIELTERYTKVQKTHQFLGWLQEQQNKLKETPKEDGDGKGKILTME